MKDFIKKLWRGEETMEDLSLRIKKLKELLDNSDSVIIGAGAGLSTASGISYGGERFKKNFPDFIKKYNLTDMYSATFYPFPSPEARWAYLARHVYLNNLNMEATELYKNILKLVEDKDYFVITTNVDDQFFKSGFDPSKIYATQGSYRLFQCSVPCHDKLYDNEKIIKEMLDNTDEDLTIPSELIPKCPKCGNPMELNLRIDNTFVEDATWHEQNRAYYDFINKSRDNKTLLLEFGIGFNTPTIIRLPFDAMNAKWTNWNLARFNLEHLEVAIEIDDRYHLFPIDGLNSYKIPNNFKERYLPFNEDINFVVNELLK